MLRATTLILLSLATAVPAMAAPKYAIVRVTDIYRNLTSTHTMLESIQKERDEIMKDERAVHLRNVVEEMSKLQSQLQAKRDSPVDDNVRMLAQQYEIKRQEGQTLQEEFETFESEQKKEINRRMVAAMRSSLSKIDSATRKIAEEHGFDAAFDSSGISNTGLPILLYSKNAQDITKDVVARLQDTGEPSGPPPATASDPSAPTAPVAPAPAPDAAVAPEP